jgi:hypothetical protein
MQQTMIRSTILNIEVDGTKSDGMMLQSRLGAMFHDDLTPIMERVFYRCVPDEEHWMIDRLVIDAGDFTLESFERDFAKAFALALERAVKERTATTFRIAGERKFDPDSLSKKEFTPDTASNAPSKSEAVLRAFTYFLETGVLPWWFKLAAGATLENEILVLLSSQSGTDHTTTTITQSLASARARTRLVNQFSTQLLKKLIPILSPADATSVLGFIGMLLLEGSDQVQSVRITKSVWQAITEMLVQRQSFNVENFIATWRTIFLPTRSGESDLRATLQRIEPQARSRIKSNLKKIEIKEVKALKILEQGVEHSKLDLEEGIFVEYAGVVLLHAFVPQLFDTLEIAKGENLTEPDQALGLLHFLATSERQAPEHTLALAKILCGLRIEDPVAAPAELTSQMVEEAEAMMQAAIRHWDALGEASIAALRTTFLMRPGKLTKRGDEYVLQVETQSFDILLDRLPWGISAVKFPWMKSILWVEWRL